MRKKTVKKISIWMLALLTVFALVAFLPGLNFKVGNEEYVSVERISNDNHKYGMVYIADKGLGYSWYYAEPDILTTVFNPEGFFNTTDGWSYRKGCFIIGASTRIRPFQYTLEDTLND